jgi:CRISPR system Cascade subunit CasB
VTTLEPVPTEAATSPVTPRRNDLFGVLASHIAHAAPGDRAALSRLQAEALQPHQLAALSRALLAAGLSPDQWHTDTWPRWALIAHGMALAGHDGKQRLGAQLAQAGVSESRVTKLLTSRGDAFTQLLPRILRLLASKGVKPNWHELGALILNQSSADRQKQIDAEANRMAIAGPYFSALARTAR